MIHESNANQMPVKQSYKAALRQRSALLNSKQPKIELWIFHLPSYQTHLYNS